jgi:hypothetical protein
VSGRRAKVIRRRELLVGQELTPLLTYMALPSWGFADDDVATALSLAKRTNVLMRLGSVIEPPGRKGRPRKHSTFEGLLTGLALNVIIHNMAPHLSQVTRTLYTRIPQSWRERFQTNHPFHTKKQRSNADRATERLWNKFKRSVDGEPLRAAIQEAQAAGESDLSSIEELRAWAGDRYPPEVLEEMDDLRLWVCNRIIWAVASILFEDMAGVISLEDVLAGIDATFFYVNSHGPREGRPAADDQAGWYVREGIDPRWGLEGHIAHLASDPTCGFRDVPEVPVGISVDRPGVSPTRNGLAALQQAIINGMPLGTIGFDTAYNTPDFKQKAMAMGMGLLYRPRAHGADDHPDHLGALMAGGQPLCPGVEPDLLRLYEARANGLDQATMYARAEEREKFRLRIHETLPDGRLRMMCPAIAPHDRKPRVCCPLRPNSYDYGTLPEVPHPPGIEGSENAVKPPGPVCVETGIVVDPMDHTDVWQDVPVLSREWRRDFPASRNTTERGHANAKATYSLAFESGDRRGPKGITSSAILASFQTAGHSFRLIASWLRNAEKDEQGKIIGPPLKNRRGKRAPKHTTGEEPDDTLADPAEVEPTAEPPPASPQPPVPPADSS